MADDELVQDWLASVEVGNDGRLPPERALAEQLGVSRATVRRALEGLEAEGRLSRHVGRGTFLLGHQPRRVASTEAKHDDLAPRDIYGARLALEPELAALAAINATNGDLSRQRDRLADLREARDRAAFELAEAAFRRAVARSAGNPLLAGLFEQVETARLAVDWGRLTDRHPAAPASDDPKLRSLETLCEALRTRDSQAAREAARHNLLVEAAATIGAAFG